MKAIYTLARRHGSPSWEVVLGPDSTPKQHRQYRKRIRIIRTHPHFADFAMVAPISRYSANPKPSHPAKKPVPFLSRLFHRGKPDLQTSKAPLTALDNSVQDNQPAPTPTLKKAKATPKKATSSFADRLSAVREKQTEIPHHD